MEKSGGLPFNLTDFLNFMLICWPGIGKQGKGKIIIFFFFPTWFNAKFDLW